MTTQTTKGTKMDIETRARGLCLMIGTDFFYKEDGERIIAFDFFKSALQAVRDEAIQHAIDICESHMRYTETPLKRAQEDGHQSEINHQEGRWHGINYVREELERSLKEKERP